MFFKESDQLAKNNPNLSTDLQAIDRYIFESAATVILLPRRVASATGTSRTKTASILHLFTDANLLTVEEMIECECGVFAPMDQRGKACSSCSEQHLESHSTQSVFRLTEHCIEHQKSATASPKQNLPDATVDRSKRDALTVAYSGVWGTKVIWLAAFTFAPLVIGLKIPFLRISVGLATAIYLAYHALGAFNWVRLRQLQQSPTHHSMEDTDRIWKYIALRHKATVPLSYAVLALLLLTIVAKVDFACGGNTKPICMPTSVYSFIAVSPPSTCSD